MNIFELQEDIISKYSKYISSFLDIQDKRIKRAVTEYIQNQELWPQPLIQFNPAYALGKSLSALCSEGILHKELNTVFSGYDLYKHQVDAIKLGATNKNFFVTSGTGSGKSLTYLATIFNHLFNEPNRKKGVKALIVYPMNALINSQLEEIKRYKKNYEEATKQEFPITFNRYTGQESKVEKQKVVDNPPDIILTNYMMLELIMTRKGERSIRDSISENLIYLVFDELHTYRGRQGSDVSLLIRRIRAKTANEITCIGTSATMASGETLTEQRKKVADVATKFFGLEFQESQIIDEELISSFDLSDRILSIEKLRSEILGGNIDSYNYSDLEKSELVFWIESNVALEEKEGRLVRKKPLNISEIAELLSSETDVDVKTCSETVKRILIRSNEVNNELKNSRGKILPFKIHQFISQTGSVLTTLDDPQNRKIVFESVAFIKDDDGEKVPVFPTVFSRISGIEFICVVKDDKSEKLVPREFRQRYEDDEDSIESGYILYDENKEIWSESDIENLPDSWFKSASGQERKLKKQYENSVPVRISFNKFGDYSLNPEVYPNKGWFIKAPLPIDPTSGVFWGGKTSEGTKLTKLGIEGRSTATTILSFSTINALAKQGLDINEQKLLSFTDNRQDAALQAGHFNDFYKVALIRSAIYHAIKNYGQLDYTQIAEKVFQSLNLDQKEYAKSPSDVPYQKAENEKIFQKILLYRILHDLKFGWRVILPNLEQCGLLKIEYKYFNETIDHAPLWKDVPLINLMTREDRADFIMQTLDFFRKNYALSHQLFEEITKVENEITHNINEAWGLAKNERIEVPYFMRVESLPRLKSNIYTSSLGSTSNFGKYIKDIAKKYNFLLDKENYTFTVYQILDTLVNAKWLDAKPINNPSGQVKIYRLSVQSIIWKLGDGNTVVPDKIRLRSYKNYKMSANKFFAELYSLDFSSIKRMIAREHTAQIKNEDRIKREDQFRNGEISLLTCSPTMELGIDIATLNVVHMRNVPPNPANYVQRGGRAGRSGQAALIMTFCSNTSPHDRHYFDNSRDMVAGVVNPAKIDLTNEELHKTHLNALFLARKGISELDSSIGLILDLEDIEQLPLLPSIAEKLKLSNQDKDELFGEFKLVVKNFESELLKTYWYNDEWIRREINNIPGNFDKALNRWRELYLTGIRQREKATEIISNPNYSNNSPEKKEAYVNQKQANRQIDLLKNSDSYSAQFSEFYPYRYLAAEGFLPGYNFTRLPIRTFIPRGEDGEFISRPRFLALREFGPSNIIYHNGSKYQIKQLIQSDLESKFQKFKIVRSSGYALYGDDYDKEVCPFTNVSLNSDEERELFASVIEQSETRSAQRENISCDEEERLRMGYDIRTYFSVKGGMDRIETVNIKDGDDILLMLRYIPAATLVKINHKWTTRKEPGFLINVKTGFWKKEKLDPKKNPEFSDIHRVHLYATDTSDALYIHPLPALGFEKGKEAESIITLQFALKRAIETLFQVESGEIGTEVLGLPEKPNMLIYESAEGSLGILSQIAKSPELFRKIIKEAYKICYFKDGEDVNPDVGPASYSDLLSYYNQRYHDRIDRHYIKEQLEKLMNCNFDHRGKSTFGSYEEQYEFLKKHLDPNSSTELEFINYLRKHDLKLPDYAQYDIPDIYVKPDFYYKDENAVIFCDGTPHDNPEIKRQDQAKRDALINKGYDVIVYYYKDSLDELVKKRNDVFKRVR